MSIPNQPTTSQNTSHTSTSRLPSISNTQATLATPSDTTTIAIVKKPFTRTDIPVIYSDIVIQSDSEMDSHEYEWGSLASHESKEDYLDTFEDKAIEGDTWIKNFWNPDIEDTSRIDRSPPETDYEKDSIDDDLNTSILTIMDTSYLMNLIEQVILIIHHEHIDWDQ